MSREFVLAMFAAVMLSACGAGSPKGAAAEAGGQSAASLASLPATVEGTLDMSAGEGDEDEGGQEVLFGVLNVSGQDHYVEIAPALVGAAAITEDIAKVRATVASKQDLGNGVISYTVTALEKL
jgi:hypothetical protein